MGATESQCRAALARAKNLPEPDASASEWWAEWLEIQHRKPWLYYGLVRLEVLATCPPHLQALLQELNQASPDRTVTPIFRPGRTPGTVEYS